MNTALPGKRPSRSRQINFLVLFHIVWVNQDSCEEGKGFRDTQNVFTIKKLDSVKISDALRLIADSDRMLQLVELLG